MQPYSSTRFTWTVILIAAIAAMPVFSGCKNAGTAKVGYVGGLTGRHYNLGLSGRNGVELAVDEINRKGGVNGKQIKLIVKDDRQEPEAALSADRELIAEGVKIIIGHMTSAMTKAVLPELGSQDVLIISPTTSSSEFAGKDDNFIMLYPTTRIGAEHMARYAAGKLGLKKVTVVYDLSNKSYSETWATFFKAAFEGLNSSVPSMITFTSGPETSFSELAGKALKDRPDGVLLVAGALDTAMISQHLKKLSPRTQILSGEWAFTSDIIQHGGAAVEGAFFIQKVNMESTTPGFLAFREDYAKRFGKDPDFAAVMAYESVMVAAEGMRKSSSPREIKAAILNKGAFSGLDSEFSIDKNGDAVRRHYIMTIREGKFRVVETAQ